MGVVRGATSGIVLAGRGPGGAALADADDRAAQALTDRWIEPNPWYPGVAEACLRDYGLPVWALVAYLQGARGGPKQVAAHYDLPLEAVDAAIAYCQQHRSVLDERIVGQRTAA